MAGGGRCRRRRSRVSSIRRRGVGAKLSVHGGGIEDNVKPDNREHGEWICQHGHRITRRGHMRVDANGGLYVLDSEDEDAGMEMEAGGVDLADLGGASVTPDAVTIGRDGVMGNGVDVAAEESIPADAVNIEEDAGTGEEMDPKVAARLKMLLDHIDPTFRDVFVSMLKVLVPAFFDP
ncbi:unnamed protein product [Urochloa humidicola]